MRNKFSRLALAATFCLGASVAPALDYSVMLPEKVVNELPAQARSVYQLAVEANERANYSGTAKLLGEAAELAPEVEEIQFLAIARARDRADVYYGTGVYTLPPENMEYSSPPWHVAEPFFDIAEQSLQRLSHLPDLTEEERRRLQREILLVEQGKASLSQRDQARLDIAFDFVISVRDKRLAARGLTLAAPDDGETGSTDPALAGEGAIGEGDGSAESTNGESYDPFALLPGETIADWLPLPQPTRTVDGQGGRNPFGNDGGGAPPDFGGTPDAPPPTGGNPFDNPAPTDLPPANPGDSSGGADSPF